MEAHCYVLEVIENTLKVSIELRGIPMDQLEAWKERLGKTFKVVSLEVKA